MNAIRRGIRNTFRNATRSVGVVVILGVTIALSISMLIARDAVNTKIASVRASTGTTVTVSPAGFFGFQGGGTPLSNKQIDTLVTLPYVIAVQASLNEELQSSVTSLTSPTPPGFLGHHFGGFSSRGGFSIPVRFVGTNSPGTALVFFTNAGATEKLTSGTAFSATSTANVAVVGTSLATTNKLSVGSTFTAWGTKVTVVGIYSSGSTFADADALMPLATVQKLAGATNQVTGATVTADNLNNVTAVANEIKRLLGSAADVTSSQATISSELSPLNSVKTISTYTLFGSVIGAAIILLLSMLMIVRERRREIGVLKAIGASNRSIVTQFIAESTTFTVFGAVIGFLAGVAISSPITSALVSASSGSANVTGFVRRPDGGPSFGAGGSGFAPPGGPGNGDGHFHFGDFHNTITQIHTAAGWSTLAYALLMALVIAGASSAVASFTITRVRPADVLRSE